VEHILLFTIIKMENNKINSNTEDKTIKKEVKSEDKKDLENKKVVEDKKIQELIYQNLNYII
jgi:hypothetical protein